MGDRRCTFVITPIEVGVEWRCVGAIVIGVVIDVVEDEVGVVVGEAVDVAVVIGALGDGSVV